MPPGCHIFERFDYIKSVDTSTRNLDKRMTSMKYLEWYPEKQHLVIPDLRSLLITTAVKNKGDSIIPTHAATVYCGIFLNTPQAASGDGHINLYSQSSVTSNSSGTVATARRVDIRPLVHTFDGAAACSLPDRMCYRATDSYARAYRI
jgi:hypothetical protein